MKNKVLLLGLGLHVFIGVLLYLAPVLSYVYNHLIFVLGFLWVWQNRNANEEALLVCAYLVGAEVLIRMTRGYFIWEFTKYFVIATLLLGMYFRGSSKKALPYWIIIFLFLPGIFLGIDALGDEPRMRKFIMFNLSGPLCLIIAALYCYQRPIGFAFFQRILWMLGLPLFAMLVFLFLYSPDSKEVFVHTGSNFTTSGGYGPNQVATVLGLGMFVFFVRALFASPNTFQLVVNLVLIGLFAYRGILTFSRGGLITATAMILLTLGVTYAKGSSWARVKISGLFAIVTGGLIAAFLYSTVVTGGMILNRYQNKDALGREKGSVLSGREGIAQSEIEMFLMDPVFGSGIGYGYVYRRDVHDHAIASHNEVTRLLGEHGTIGIIILLFLSFTPIALYLNNRQNFFILSLMCFWFLTLNHTAMRIAAPSFIYALALLKLDFHERNTVSG